MLLGRPLRTLQEAQPTRCPESPGEESLPPPTPAALLCWLNSPTITPRDGARRWTKVGTGVLTQGSPQQPRDPRGRACSPTSGRPGSPPQLPGGSVPHKTEPDPCPQTLETRKGSMRVRPAPWGGGPLNPKLD